MMDTLAALMFMENLEEDVQQGVPLRTGNTSRSGPTGLYHASDADLIITAASDDQWRRLCEALSSPELLEDPTLHRLRFPGHKCRRSPGRGATARRQDDPGRNPGAVGRVRRAMRTGPHRAGHHGRPPLLPDGEPSNPCATGPWMTPCPVG